MKSSLTPSASAARASESITQQWVPLPRRAGGPLGQQVHDNQGGEGVAAPPVRSSMYTGSGQCRTGRPERSVIRRLPRPSDYWS